VTPDPAATGDAAPAQYDCVFVEGEFVSSDAARLSVKANAVSYGTGVFGGMRATWNETRSRSPSSEATA
jgi:branched-chain amino acid aminotransferase